MDLTRPLEGKIIVREINGACLPIEAFPRFVSQNNLFFLDSALQIKGIARYSFLGFNPFLIIKTKHRKVTLICGEELTEFEGNPFEAFRSI